MNDMEKEVQDASNIEGKYEEEKEKKIVSNILNVFYSILTVVISFLTSNKF